MQQYWINQDGVQAGPVTVEQMEKMSITGKAYVWRSGLEDWVKITELPELAGVWQSPTQNVPPVPPVTQATPPAIPVEEPAAEEPQPEAEPEPTANCEAEPTSEDFADAGCDSQQAMPQPPEIPQGYGCQPQQADEEAPECPPSNLVWAIISILFCQPLGIIAVILSVMVKNNYRDGNIKRASKFSEWSAWCCILAITLGVASCLILPLEFLL